MLYSDWILHNGAMKFSPIRGMLNTWLPIPVSLTKEFYFLIGGLRITIIHETENNFWQFVPQSVSVCETDHGFTTMPN